MESLTKGSNAKTMKVSSSYQVETVLKDYESGIIKS